MSTDSSNYSPEFSENKAVGIVWGTKVDYATWFGANVEFIHCIQMIPFTPISEELLPYCWIKEEYQVLKQADKRDKPELTQQWKGYIIMAHAIINQSAAWKEALDLTGFDDGNTRSNTLYWIATRPENSDNCPSPTTPPPVTTTTILTTTSTISTPSTSSTSTSTRCCTNPDQPSMTDARCLDTSSDPFGGMGCNACGINDCRFCGPPDFNNINCTDDYVTTVATTSTTPGPEDCPCSENAHYDERCTNDEPYEGLGCNACLRPNCRFCDIPGYPPCPCGFQDHPDCPQEDIQAGDMIKGIQEKIKNDFYNGDMPGKCKWWKMHLCSESEVSALIQCRQKLGSDLGNYRSCMDDVLANSTECNWDEFCCLAPKVQDLLEEQTLPLTAKMLEGVIERQCNDTTAVTQSSTTTATPYEDPFDLALRDEFKDLPDCLSCLSNCKNETMDTCTEECLGLDLSTDDTKINAMKYIVTMAQLNETTKGTGDTSDKYGCVAPVGCSGPAVEAIYTCFAELGWDEAQRVKYPACTWARAEMGACGNCLCNRLVDTLNEHLTFPLNMFFKGNLFEPMCEALIPK